MGTLQGLIDLLQQECTTAEQLQLIESLRRSLLELKKAWEQENKSSGAQLSLAAESVVEYQPASKATSPTRPVLLAEDNPLNQLVVRLMLEGAGYTVLLANNGRECLKAFEAQRDALVLMDLDMPVMNGLECARRIRKKHGSKPTIVALTASPVGTHGRDFAEQGFNHYLVKPVNRETLLRTVAEADSKETI